MLARAIFIPLLILGLVGCAVATPTAPLPAAEVTPEASTAPISCQPDALVAEVLAAEPSVEVTADLRGADVGPYIAAIASAATNSKRIIEAGRGADRVIALKDPATTELLVLVIAGGCIVRGISITQPSPGEPA